MIKIKDLQTQKEMDRKLGVKLFLKKFKKLQTPNCYLCSAAKGDRYVKVDHFSVDYDPESNHLIFKCKCHGDEIWLYRDFEETMRLDKLDTRMVFKENQGYRQDGKIITLITRRHALDDTHAY